MKHADAELIVDRIIADLAGRLGLDQQLERIDARVKTEIKERWVEIVLGEANRR